MIRFKTGNILHEDAEALVNTVNCVGVMGRGIALQFKKAYPENFRAYARACEAGAVRPGRVFVYETGALTNPRFILNFPTKRHWRSRSRMHDIEAGLVDLAKEVRARGIRSIALPPLGSGLGGLDWGRVRERAEAALSDLDDVNVVIFEPSDEWKSERSVAPPARPKMTAARAVMVELMDRYTRGLLDPFVTLLEVHKLMYFMQAAGEGLRLRFSKGPYGPYAENLRHVLHAVEGHFVSGYEDGGDAPAKPLELLPGAVEKAATFVDGANDTGQRLHRVSDLIEGFESPYGLELLATVHWILNDDAWTGNDVVPAVHGWDRRKRKFTPRQVELARDALVEQGWTPGSAACGPLFQGV